MFLLETVTKKIFTRKEDGKKGDEVGALGEDNKPVWRNFKKKIGGTIYNVNAVGEVTNTTVGGGFVGTLGPDGKIVPGARPE